MAKVVEEEKRARHPFVSKPIRKKKLRVRKEGGFGKFASSVAEYFPDLEKKLRMAEMDPDPGKFISRVFLASIVYTVILMIGLFAVFYFFDLELLFLIPIAIVLFVIMFFFWKMLPSVKMLQRARRIDQDIVFAGRHIVIALKSGIPLFDALVGVTEDYGKVSSEFNKIVEEISLGKSVTASMREAAENSPSKYFNRVVLQMVNAVVSGSDIADALDSVLDQIAEEQVIALRGYGQKLNPLSMFYMLFGIIFPSLGVVFLIVVMTFAGGATAAIGPVLLPLVFILVVAIQFSFVSIMESSRPRFELT